MAMPATTLLLLLLLLLSLTSSFSPLPTFTRSSLFQLHLTVPQACSVLNIHTSAPPPEIKRAYRKLALKYHPDVSPNTRDKFDAVSEAYKLLANPQKAPPPPPRSSSSSSSYTSSSSSSSSYTSYTSHQAEEDKRYATEDSFSSILSDLFSSAASSASSYASSSSSPSILNDLLTFLESNVDGFSSFDDDDSVTDLLASTDITLILAELDDTTDIVTTLETKLSSLTQSVKSKQEELTKIKAGIRSSKSLAQEFELAEDIAGETSKVKVVEGHLKRVRKRQGLLQERAKVLMRARRDKRSSSQQEPPPTTPPNPKARLNAKVLEELEKLKKTLDK